MMSCSEHTSIIMFRRSGVGQTIFLCSHRVQEQNLLKVSMENALSILATCPNRSEWEPSGIQVGTIRSLLALGCSFHMIPIQNATRPIIILCPNACMHGRHYICYTKCTHGHAQYLKDGVKQKLICFLAF